MNRAVVVMGFSLLFCGCSHNEFYSDRAMGILGSQPQHLDAEQVVLTGDQVQCGISKDLWEPPVGYGNRNISRLLDAGRALHFDDDLVVEEPGFRDPHIQVRGDFMLTGDPASNIRDVEEGVKEVETRLYAVINHPCFMTPVPLMGVRHGSFSPEALNVTRFELTDNGWRFVRFVHWLSAISYQLSAQRRSGRVRLGAL